MSGKRSPNKNSFETTLDLSTPAVCRICHSGDNSIPYWGDDFGEPLISPCKCKGSTGLLHRSCMLYWLRTNKKKCCEICKHEFKTVRVLPSFADFIQFRGFGRFMDTNLGVDISMFFIITAICYTAGPLLLFSAVQSDDWMAKTLLAVMILFMHLFWCVSVAVSHYMTWQEWRRKNPRDVFVDRDLNESFSFTTKRSGFLAGLFCCCSRRRQVADSAGLSSVLSPVQSLYGTVSQANPPLATPIVGRRGRESGEREEYSPEVRPMLNTIDGSLAARASTVVEVERRASMAVPMSTFLPQRASSPQQTSSVGSDSGPRGLDVSRALSPLDRDSSGDGQQRERDETVRMGEEESPQGIMRIAFRSPEYPSPPYRSANNSSSFSRYHTAEGSVKSQSPPSYDHGSSFSSSFTSTVSPSNVSLTTPSTSNRPPAENIPLVNND